MGVDVSYIKFSDNTWVNAATLLTGSIGRDQGAPMGTNAQAVLSGGYVLATSGATNTTKNFVYSTSVQSDGTNLGNAVFGAGTNSSLTKGYTQGGYTGSVVIATGSRYTFASAGVTSGSSLSTARTWVRGTGTMPSASTS